jgi:membrane protease YdiL (CAAX protease family)
VPATSHTERSPEGHRARTIRFALVVAAVAIVWNLVGNLVLPGAWYVPANLAVAAGLTATARAAGLDWSELGMARERLGRGAAVGAVSMLVVGLAIALLVAVPATRSFFESSDVARDDTGERWFTALVRIPLGTAVFEEVLFRSVLLGALLRLRGRAGAVALSAILFGLWHVVPAWETAEGSGGAVVAAIVGTVAITTVAGVLFALLRLHARSVLAPVLAHTATNSFAYVAAIVATG